MKQFILVILIIIVGNQAYSGNREIIEKFNEADNFYEQNNFEEALKLYNEIIAEGYESGDLYFNIANTYYRMNIVGLSVYYFEKARISDPVNEDITYNLELALLRIKNRPAVMPELAVVSFFKQIIMFRTNDFWGILSLVLFIGFLFVLFSFMNSNSPRQKKVRFLISSIIFVFSLISFLFAQYQTGRINSDDIAIIISQEINAKSSPDENATDLFKIYEGYKIYIEKRSDDWSEIKLTDGKKAWIKNEHFKII